MNITVYIAAYEAIEYVLHSCQSLSFGTYVLASFSKELIQWYLDGTWYGVRYH